jgi:hypothetical protein
MRIWRMTARIERISTTGLDAARAGPNEHFRRREDPRAEPEKAKTLGCGWRGTPDRSSDLDPTAKRDSE